MQLQRISKQQPESIEEYYNRLKADSSDWDSARIQIMIDLIRCLEMHRPDTKTWVYTSGEKLVFTNVDDAGLGLTIEPKAKSYIITYPLMPEEAPWEGAVIEGITPDLVEATQMISLALERLRKEQR